MNSYHNYIPANARVNIEFSKDEPVSFSYPREWTYWKAVWKIAYSNVFLLWITINFKTISYVSWVALPVLSLKYLFFPVSVYLPGDFIVYDWTFILRLLLSILIFFMYFYGLPALFTLWLAQDKDKMARWIPKIGYWARIMLRGYEAVKVWEAKDIVDNKLVLPNFSNVYLDYEASGSMGECLERIQVLEYKFDWVKKGVFKKKEKNDYVWYAVFTFKQMPQDGSLKVKFI